MANWYLDGISFRKIGKQLGCVGSLVYKTVKVFLNQLPSNLDITGEFCNVSKFSGLLEVDGTYVNVKGYKNKIPAIYGVDFLTHDIPHFALVPSESYQAYLVFFKHIELLGYNLRYLVCDDNNNIKRSARYIFPDVVIQTCLKHYRSNIQDDLGLKTSKKYLDFYLEINGIFENRLCLPELFFEVVRISKIYTNDEKYIFWLSDILRRREELTNYHYHKFEYAPNTTNLIEGFNSHLKSRTDSLRRFSSFKSAKTWLNAYFLKRGLSKFTDCKGMFKKLNGFCSLEKTKKDEVLLPKLF
ncbi:transposase [Candidatus Parcubacteria bacterium]|nr:transposase [Patescibacteria group bacterium]MCG2688888.1 transposase [Candidatus Parcubacteria bacterium]